LKQGFSESIFRLAEEAWQNKLRLVFLGRNRFKLPQGAASWDSGIIKWSLYTLIAKKMPSAFIAIWVWPQTGKGCYGAVSKALNKCQSKCLKPLKGPHEGSLPWMLDGRRVCDYDFDYRWRAMCYYGNLIPRVSIGPAWRAKGLLMSMAETSCPPLAGFLSWWQLEVLWFCCCCI